jgi:hypothetical protein
MRLKYIVETDHKNNLLVLRELAATDQDRFELLNHATYEGEMIKSAIPKGKKALVSALRTDNMYPPAPIAEKIAEAISQAVDSKEGRTVELIVDDLDNMEKRRKRVPIPKPEDMEETSSDLDVETDSDETGTIGFDENDTDLYEEMFPFNEVA